ncbi:sucrose-6-phosphate hydrolase [Exiguobacterium mexicanum]
MNTKIDTSDRYRSLDQAVPGELERLEKQAALSKWKPSYHIHPGFGLLNDPNGLAYYNGAFHVFYQWHPFAPTHAMKHWAHVSSKNLVDWERQKVALVPEHDYEANGTYSGTSIEIDGKLHLYYTGNIKYTDGGRSANQCLAVMSHHGAIEKYPLNPLIEGPPSGYTGHVRDPKVVRYKDGYKMLLGAQRLDGTGAIIVYSSSDGIGWSFEGEVTLKGYDESGFMLECPDYFQLEGKDVLLLSPQGIAPQDGRYENLYNVVYLVGEMNWDTLQFDVDFYEELDRGFDIYAPQTFEVDGQRILFAWAGMGEVDYPSDREEWAHSLTLPRQLTLRGNRLIQQPVEALALLRNRSESVHEQDAFHFTPISNHFELEFTLSGDISTVTLFHQYDRGLRLEIDHLQGQVVLDRSKTNYPFGEQYGTTRRGEIRPGEATVRIFVDGSVVEVYLNGGELVFTTRYFFDDGDISLEAQDIKGNIYQLRQSIADKLTME